MCELTLPLLFFFFNDTATTEIYTLSLHDALPICGSSSPMPAPPSPHRSTTKRRSNRSPTWRCRRSPTDRKSTRLNSSHVEISYAVFCLKKKKKKKNTNNDAESQDHLAITYATTAI